MVMAATLVAETLADGLLPDLPLSVAEWAARHRVLEGSYASSPGPWRNEKTPYLVEIMDCLSARSSVREVVFMKGAQVGATEAGSNWIGYMIDHAPGTMLMVQPRDTDLQRVSKQRISPLIRKTPSIAKRISSGKSRDSGNTILQKDFDGGSLIMTGANSAAGLRGTPARYLFLDEVDGYPKNVDGEGDPVRLAEVRTSNFANTKKVFKCSTPVLKGSSRIERSFERSDQRYYHVPCPHCDHFQSLAWKQLKYEVREPEYRAWYECEECGEEIEEWHKTDMLARGYWVPTHPEREVRGYHLSGLYSPLGWASWAQLAKEWVEAQGKPEELQQFINTRLGESWVEQGEAPDWEALYERRENYAVGTVPAGAAFLTAGVDVQGDRLEVEVVGWGRGRESWSVDYRVLMGDTAKPDVWVELDKMLEETWPHELGTQMSIEKMAVDSGYNTQDVYNWTRKHPFGRVMAIKGQDTATVIIGHAKAVDVDYRGRTIKRGAHVWSVGSAIAKTELYGWLRLRRPTEEGEPLPPGYCHFPQYEREWFEQLTAEEIRTKEVKGYTRRAWEKTRARNEALDCRVYARAAASVVGIDRWSEGHWDQVEAALRPDTQPKAAPPPPKPNPFRRGRGGFGRR